MDFGKLFSFEGRIGRRSFWLSTLIVVAFVLVVGGVLFAINEVLAVLAYIPMIWVSLATSVKRWHDRGKAGTWVLIGLIPLVGLWAIIETGFLAGEPAPNEYGVPESGSPFGSAELAPRSI